MSVQSEINRVKSNVASAYSAVASKGGTVPSAANSANLAAAVNSIPGVPNPLPIANGGTGGTTAVEATKNLIEALPAQTGTYYAETMCFPFYDSTDDSATHVGSLPLASFRSFLGNRRTNVTGSNTAYTTYMSRGMALVTSVPTSMTNGTVALLYV